MRDDSSFIELKARQRAQALLDEGSYRELLDPFEGIISPWLGPQGIVPQADDGMVVAKGTINGKPAVVVAIEGAFQGGSMGEVSGAKMAAALCSYLIVTREARLGLNGPQVIEQEAGIEEYDSRDRPFIWSMTGGEVRYQSGLVDALVGDGINAVKQAMNDAIAKGVPAKHRTDNYDDYLNRLTNFDTRKQADAEQINALFAREVK